MGEFYNLVILFYNTIMLNVLTRENKTVTVNPIQLASKNVCAIYVISIVLFHMIQMYKCSFKVCKNVKHCHS